MSMPISLWHGVWQNSPTEAAMDKKEAIKTEEQRAWWQVQKYEQIGSISAVAQAWVVRQAWLLFKVNPRHVLIRSVICHLSARCHYPAGWVVLLSTTSKHKFLVFIGLYFTLNKLFVNYKPSFIKWQEKTQSTICLANESHHRFIYLFALYLPSVKHHSV